ncbi:MULTISPECIES: nitroreductase family protein [Desulfitobacterium]|uniref:Nitroreductase n=1 Tax=Desulfitobacterium dehalogenans (strain ATCC 51507 / DSM 9161 / JW/IU-DC1) TaxID=756499 RepID=I4A6Y2_DESDJ|nr:MULTISPECIES: nitroreductase family protein [Desulfitobacterium]AFL99716.1 nitroreductase [Desulfitobacterium dehalogenans ATCC 51507]
MDTIKAIGLRKSVRSYLPKSVEAEIINQLVRAGNSAPKVGFFHTSVIENPEVLKEINEEALVQYKNSGDKLLMGRAALEGYQPLYGAPVFFLFSAPFANPLKEATTSCAVTCITIAATSLGLGSCYIHSALQGIKGNSQLMGKIGIPFGLTPICGVVVGYSAEDSLPPYRSTEENVNYCR